MTEHECQLKPEDAPLNISGGDGGLPTSNTGSLGGADPDIADEVDLGTEASRAAALQNPDSTVEERENVRRNAVKQAQQAPNRPQGPQHRSTKTDSANAGVLPTTDLMGAADVNPLGGSAGALEEETATGSGGLPDRSTPPQGSEQQGGVGNLPAAADSGGTTAIDHPTEHTTTGVGGVPDRGTSAGVGTLHGGSAGGGTDTGFGSLGDRSTPIDER